MVNFTKMHGLGNDFVVMHQNLLSTKRIAALSDRRTGIGFDQLLMIGPSQKADFFCRIFNADGSEAEQCGNGMRCIGRYLHEEKLIQKNTVLIETISGLTRITIKDYDHITTALNPPIFDTLTQLKEKDKIIEPIYILSLGNPHAVLPVTSLNAFSIQEMGQRLSLHSYFPEQANIGFMEIINRQHIRLRTYERGSGLTLACGSNAAAAVAAGIKHNLLDVRVTVELALGNLLVEWPDQEKSIYITGPAGRVFEGNVH